MKCHVEIDHLSINFLFVSVILLWKGKYFLILKLKILNLNFNYEIIFNTIFFNMRFFYMNLIERQCIYGLSEIEWLEVQFYY